MRSIDRSGTLGPAGPANGTVGRPGHRRTIRALVLVVATFVAACTPEPGVDSGAETAEAEQGEFVALMEELAAAWNAGDARRAADCFASDAVYSEPPDKQLYRGREALYEFFGGAEGRRGQMSMEWHHLAFDRSKQIGFGEFTFRYGSAAHGIVVVRLRDGKIGNWREYWYESDLAWEDFVVENPF